MKEEFIFNINRALINTIRIHIFQKVPEKCFTKIIIIKNTSCYDNNELEDRFSMIPLKGDEITETEFIDFINQEQNDNKTISTIETSTNQIFDDEQLTEYNFETNYMLLSSLQNVKGVALYCKVKNDNKNMDVMYVTTEHCRYYKNGNEISNPYNELPLLLCKLRLNQELEFVAYSSIEIANNNPLWEPIRNCWFVELESNKYKFTIISKGQTYPRDIIIRAVKIIEQRIDKFSKILQDNEKDLNSNPIQINIQDDKYSIGDVLSHYLRLDKNVKMANYKVPHIMKDESILSVRFEDNITDKIFDIFMNCFERIKEDLNICILNLNK